MKNREVADLLHDIADLLELKGELVFKVNAYRKAARAIENMTQPVEDFWKSGRLGDIQGVGKGIAEHIEEYLSKGRSGYYEKMKKGMPMDFESLRRVEGLGPRKIKALYEKLKIKTVKDLKAAAKAGKIRKLAGFGEKTEQNILKSIEFSLSPQRMLLGRALPAAEEITDYMKKDKSVIRAAHAGSLRRMRETIGDIDILATAKDAAAAIDRFVNMPGVTGITAKGPTRASVRFNGMQADLRVLKDSEYGSALLYFTGSKDHNVGLRKIAISKGMKLSEYGLLRSGKLVAGRTEDEIYGALGLQYVEPEMREDRGEIELAKKKRLPCIVGYGDILGDLQMHTTWSDGADTIKDMAVAAKHIGYEYICVTDHLGRLKIANAMSEKYADRQRKEIEKAQESAGIRIFHGAEIDVRADGKLDVSSGCLKKFDIVLAALHSAFKGTAQRNTDRLVKAMENPDVDIIAHPTGRLINRREGADIDIQKVSMKAAETGTLLEINSQPDRLDMSDVNARTAVENGCRLVIDTDSHSAEQLQFMKYGVAVARRAWCTRKDILNSLPLGKFARELGLEK